jgi:hypothetical protein
MKKLLLAGLALAPLACCALPPANSNALLTALTNLANTGTGDLNSAIAVANAATPPDTDGAACASGGLAVVASMQKELSALPAGATVGVFTLAEVASLYQPGSAQANAVVKTLETACIAKLHDINQTGAAAVGVFSTIGSVVAAGA